MLKKLTLHNITQPLIMGILNATPDSFSDGEHYLKLAPALKHAESMIEHGVDIIDVGGESTRPGAKAVSASEEIKRVIPLVTQLKKMNVWVSVDTSKTSVMQAAIDAGADMINDVKALTAQGAIDVVAKSQLPVCLMHMQGTPTTMQKSPQYEHVVKSVKSYLEQRIEACVAGGIAEQAICLDPGFGFGKTLQHNLTLLKQLNVIAEVKGETEKHWPVLVGMSRKSMIGEMTGKPIDQRLAGSLGLALIAMQQGAKLIRVHDVKETVDIKNIYLACQ